MDGVVTNPSANETSTNDEFLTGNEFIPEMIPQWMVDLGASILVIILAWITARILVRLFGRRIARRIQRPSLTRVSLVAIRVGVYVFALLTILRINGMDLGNIALSVTVFSAVVGVILAPIVGSIISGFFLLADQPYEIGDLIEFSDNHQRGFVDDITLRYTKIFTLDNTFLVVPNGEMRERDVVNFSAEDSRVRLSVDVVITYESDLSLARRQIEESARSVQGVISGGPDIRVGGARYTARPECLINEFADDGIRLRLRYWVQEPYRIHGIKSAVQSNIWDAIADEDVEIAYPHTHHVFDDTSGQVAVGLAQGDSGDSGNGPERELPPRHSDPASGGSNPEEPPS